MAAKRFGGIAVWIGLLAGFCQAAEPPAEFVRGINLNGPALTIDGRLWESGDSPNFQSQDQAFETQDVPLVPPTDPERAMMIRSSRWNGSVNMTFNGLGEGVYQLFAYVWEDNNSERYNVSVNGREVVHDFNSGAAGEWHRLGPWKATAESGAIRVTTQGGAANFSGVEIWKGPGSVPDPTAEPASEPRDPAVVKRFDEEIAPIFARHCLECHNGSIRKGNLDLGNEKTAFEGGDGGAAIEPGKPEESLLWEQIDSDTMPQGKDRPKLSAAEKDVLKSWIADGAAWGSPRIDPFLATTERRAGYDWWSFQPITRPAAPAAKQASDIKNDIDYFIRASLEQRGLSQAPEADRRTLIRRLSFDLTGLPPEPEEVEQFVNDHDESAYAKLVDRLLDSPRYGERWARHWLDVVRFGESQGFERNRVRENAWRYRDWVINAFNSDMPYDEFIRRQIAGDVIAPDDYDSLIATGYHVCGTWDQVAHNEGSESMRKAIRWDEMEDYVATLGQSFLGLSIQCARCHDHKFDPISQKEYYQVAALLGGVTQEEKERQGIKARPKNDGGFGFDGVAHVIIPKQPPAYFVFDRGDSRKPLEVVSPAGLKAIGELPADFGLKPDAPEAERRLALAKWLTDPRNPLPARVLVNRLWYYHIGRGLVETPSDFGYNGGRPSHPELLDYLASKFVDGGWKIKDIQRLIVNSATYRQASQVKNADAEAVDAENQLLWRANRRRLEGEAVRDATLAVAGALNGQIGGPSYRDMKLEKAMNDTFTDPTGEFSPATNRRSIYRLWARSGNHPMLESLDCPDPSVMAPRRTSTITPVQSLALLNDALMEKTAARFAERVRKSAGDDATAEINQAWLLAFGRLPSDREREIARSFLQQNGLEQFCLVLFNTNEFLFVN
jgi:hypothetical protein